MPVRGEDIGSSQSIPLDLPIHGPTTSPVDPVADKRAELEARLKKLGEERNSLARQYAQAGYGTESQFWGRVVAVQMKKSGTSRPGDYLIERLFQIRRQEQSLQNDLASLPPFTPRSMDTDEWSMEEKQILWKLQAEYTDAVGRERTARDNLEKGTGSQAALDAATLKRQQIQAQLEGLQGLMRDPKWLAGDEAMAWSYARKFYESLKYAVANGQFKDELKGRVEELLQTLENPEALAQFVGMLAAGMAIKKGIKCGTGLATGAGAVLTAGEVAAFLLQVEALRRELESITYQSEVANAAPHVAEFTLDILSDVGFMEWIKKWSCFPAGTQVVVGVEPDESLPAGRRYITRAIETLRPGDMVLARQEFGERLGLQPVLDVFHNRAAHLRWLTVETADGQTSELPTTDSHPFWIHECQAWVEAGALQAGLTFSGPHQQPVKLRSTRLEEFPELRPVYTLEVHDYPTFFVLPAGSSVPVLVHNNKKCVKAGNGTKGNATDGASKSGEYRDARGHHVHSKAGFKDHPNYDPNTGFSISRDYMNARDGIISP